MTDPVMDRLIDEVAGSVGAEYGMTASQVMQHIAIGDHRHHQAPDDVCGMQDPRFEEKWCVRPPGHEGWHNHYSLNEDSV